MGLLLLVVAVVDFVIVIGYFRKVNQDRFCIATFPSSLNCPSPQKRLLAAVFDGHGVLGHNAALLGSKYCQ